MIVGRVLVGWFIYILYIIDRISILLFKLWYIYLYNYDDRWMMIDGW